MCGVPEVTQVLGADRTVVAQLLTQPINRILTRVAAEHQGRRVARGDPEQHENQRQDEEDLYCNTAEPTQDEPDHRRIPGRESA